MCACVIVIWVGGWRSELFKDINNRKSSFKSWLLLLTLLLLLELHSPLSLTANRDSVQNETEPKETTLIKPFGHWSLVTVISRVFIIFTTISFIPLGFRKK